MKRIKNKAKYHVRTKPEIYDENGKKLPMVLLTTDLWTFIENSEKDNKTFVHHNDLIAFFSQNKKVIPLKKKEGEPGNTPNVATPIGKYKKNQNQKQTPAKKTNQTPVKNQNQTPAKKKNQKKNTPAKKKEVPLKFDDDESSESMKVKTNQKKNTPAKKKEIPLKFDDDESSESMKVESLLNPVVSKPLLEGERDDSSSELEKKKKEEFDGN